MTNISNKGGKFQGESHENGGIKFTVPETGQQIEVEGEEFEIPAEINQDKNIYEFSGTNKQVIDQVLKTVGAKTTNQKATQVHAGDMIVCKASAGDDTVRTYKGTLKQIISQVNQSGGCVAIHKQGGQVMGDGGVIDKIQQPHFDVEISTPEQAAEYGIKAKKPLYLKTLYVPENQRGKTYGTKLLEEVEDYAKKNSCDVIFGFIAPKAKMSDSYNEKFPHFNDHMKIKAWLNDRGYATNDYYNDFHKVVGWEDEKERTLYHISDTPTPTFTKEQINEIGVHFFENEKDCFNKQNRGYIHKCKVKMGNNLNVPFDMKKWSKSGVEERLKFGNIDWDNLDSITYLNRTEINPYTSKPVTSHIILNPEEIKVEEISHKASPNVKTDLSHLYKDGGDITDLQQKEKNKAIKHHFKAIQNLKNSLRKAEMDFYRASNEYDKRCETGHTTGGLFDVPLECTDETYKQHMRPYVEKIAQIKANIDLEKSSIEHTKKRILSQSEIFSVGGEISKDDIEKQIYSRLSEKYKDSPEKLEILKQKLSVKPEIKPEVIKENDEEIEKPSKYEPEEEIKKVFHGIEVSPDDIDYDIAYRSSQNTSFVPEKRAKQRQLEYLTYMENFSSHLDKYAENEDQKKLANELMAEYKELFIKYYQDYLISRSRVASTMITGPANFPTARNEKANRAAENKYNKLSEWSDRFYTRSKKRLLNKRSDEDVLNQEVSQIKKDITESLATIIGINSGEIKGFDKRLFSASVSGKIERLVNNGRVDVLEVIIQHIKKISDSQPKPLFRDNSKIWRAIEHAINVRRNKGLDEKEKIEKTALQNVEIKRNQQRRGIEISFPGRPSKQVLDWLKENKYRWGRVAKVWYTNYTEEKLQKAINYFNENKQ